MSERNCVSVKERKREREREVVFLALHFLQIVEFLLKEFNIERLRGITFNVREIKTNLS